MIDIKLLEKKPENNEPSYLDTYRANLVNRSADTSVLDKILELNKKRKELIFSAESEKSKQNKASQELGKLKREGKDTSTLQAELGKISAEVKEMEKKAGEVDAEVYNLLLTIPNMHHSSVPVGNSAEGNQIVKTVGSKPSFSFKAKEHWELGEKMGVIDFDRAAKVAGARFAFLKGGAARLERAISQFFMDLHSEKHGYTEMIPPYIANSASFVGTGQFPKFTEDVFSLKGTDYFLIPTAEVPVTNYFRDEILEEEELPKSFCAFSPCFRSEAGSAGRDTKGLIRQHQFHKVELMTFCHPDKSYEVHEQLTSHAEQCLHELELPYRRMLLCSADIGFGSAKTHDLEVWMAGAKTYREISSCSNFEDFQARRANIRFKSKGGKPQFVHTLNGSGLAVGRTLIIKPSTESW
jgi:seryl-tRNA synthetase